jgi:hypothetical protein
MRRLLSKGTLSDSLIIVTVTLILFIAIDVLAGDAILAIARNEGKKDPFRIQNVRYHHALQASYEGPAYWGPFAYWVCTNASAMKSACRDKNLDEKNFDVAFVGDSFTEGVGVTYEDSFVGMVAKAHPELKIANLGVVSYAPTIYLRKLEDYLNRGYTFKKVIIFVDISDIMDEALYFEDAAGNVRLTSEVIQPGALAFIKRNFKKALPLTYEALYYSKVGWQHLFPKSEPAPTVVAVSEDISKPNNSRPSSPAPTLPDALPSYTRLSESTETRRLDLDSNTAQQKSVLPTNPKNRSKEPGIYDREFARSAWTYNLDASGYGALGARRSIDKAVDQMERVADLLARHNIKLSIGVYPWPAQLKYDQENSLQVQIWQKFCEHRCENFYNTFPAFFSALRSSGIDTTIERYYYPGDMHFSKGGNALIADTILNTPLITQ